jgi:nucleotide-binding universal stress UspA family protein
MKILLALDDHQESLHKAIAIATERGATLNALFVVDATWQMFTGHDWLSGSNSRVDFLEYMHQLEEQEADGAAVMFRRLAAGIPGELLTVIGDVTEEIRREAARGYDLLVLANPFTRGLEVMRDPVAKLTKNPPCDILLVAAAAK